MFYDGAGIFGLYEIVPGFIISLALIIIISLLDDKPNQDILDEFDSYTKCND